MTRLGYSPRWWLFSTIAASPPVEWWWWSQSDTTIDGLTGCSFCHTKRSDSDVDKLNEYSSLRPILLYCHLGITIAITCVTIVCNHPMKDEEKKRYSEIFIDVDIFNKDRIINGKRFLGRSHIEFAWSIRRTATRNISFSSIMQHSFHCKNPLQCK